MSEPLTNEEIEFSKTHLGDASRYICVMWTPRGPAGADRIHATIDALVSQLVAHAEALRVAREALENIANVPAVLARIDAAMKGKA